MTAPSERTPAHPTVTLRCTSCGATYADTEPLWACVCGGLLTVDYEWLAVRSRGPGRRRWSKVARLPASGATHTSCRRPLILARHR